MILQRKLNFTGYNGPFTLFMKIRDGDISLEMAEEDQKNLKENLVKLNQEIQTIKRINSYIQ